MAATIVIPDNISQAIAEATLAPVETAGVLIAGIAAFESNSPRILVRELHFVPDAAYARRERWRLSIRPEGYLEALRRAEKLGAIAIWFHTHPGRGADVRPSIHDEAVDDDLCGLFRLRTGSRYYGSIVFGQSDGHLLFSGRLLGDDSELGISRVWLIGDRWRLISQLGETLTDERFDRNVRAFGGAVQSILHGLRVAVVGCGGTGSAVAEQLVRLGVRELTLFDPDRLSLSNLSRVHETTSEDEGLNKAAVLGRRLSQVDGRCRPTTLEQSITTEAVARRLTAQDVIFGCTDDNGGRLVLSRVASFYLVPVIDCGVLISSAGDGEIRGIDGRVTVLAPGTACLICRGRVDTRRAAAELMHPEERVRLEDEGYAPALGRNEPAVIAFTTAVASAAVAELLERLIGYGGANRPSELLLRFHEREISTNVRLPVEGHYCDPSVEKLGAGDTEPFLEMTWSG